MSAPPPVGLEERTAKSFLSPPGNRHGPEYLPRHVPQDRVFPPLFDHRTIRVVLTLLVTVAMLGFVYLARRTLTVFLFAVLFAYLLEPLIPRLQRWLRLSRGRAIAALYVAIGIGLMLLIFYAGPMLVHQAEHMTEVLPGLSRRVSSGQIARQIGREHGWSYTTQIHLQQLIASHPEVFVALETQLTGYAAGAVRNVAWIVLIPILAIFFLKDGQRISAALVDLANRRNQRELVETVLQDLHQVMAHYIRSQLLLALLATGAFLLGFWRLRLAYPFVLGSIAGVLEFIPVVGPLAALVLVSSVALLTGYNHWVPLLLFLGVFRLIQDYVVSPRILGSQVKLHPLAVIFGVLVGGEMAGVLGVYLSVPILASLRVLWHHWKRLEYE